MARNLTSYLNLMKHGLGKTPDSRHLLIDTFNDAGRALFTLAQGAPHFHHWTWAVKYNYTLTIPGGQVEELELPMDFGSLIQIDFNDITAGAIIPTNVGELTRLRRAPTVDAMQVFIAFDVGRKQSNGSGPPVPVAAFWPPRADPLTNVSLTYRRTWADMDAGDANRIPDVPPDYERLLTLLARAYAVHIEDQAMANEDENVVAELARLVAMDAGKQVNYGAPAHSVRGTARARGNMMNENWYGRSIVRP